MDAQLTTVRDVIESLGGPSAVRALTGAEPNAVSNWQGRGRFPSHTFLIFKRALEAKDKSADCALWGISPAPSATGEAA